MTRDEYDPLAACFMLLFLIVVFVMAYSWTGGPTDTCEDRGGHMVPTYKGPSRCVSDDGHTIEEQR